MHFAGIAIGALALIGISEVHAASFEDLDGNLVQRVAVDLDPETYASLRQLCTQTASICPSLKVIDKSKDVVKVVASMDALKQRQVRQLVREFERVMGIDGGDPFAYVTLLADTIAKVEQNLYERLDQDASRHGMSPGYVVTRLFAYGPEGQRWFPANGYAVPPFGSQLSTRARAFVTMFKTYLRQRPAMEVVQNAGFWTDSLMHAVFGNLPWEVRLERLDAVYQHLKLTDERPSATKMASKVLLQHSMTDLVGSYLMSDSYPFNRMPPSIEINGKKQAFVLRSTVPEHFTNSDSDSEYDYSEPDDESRYLHFEMVPLTTLEEEREEQETQVEQLSHAPVKRFLKLQQLLGIHREKEDEIQTRERHYRAITNPVTNSQNFQCEMSLTARAWMGVAAWYLDRRFQLNGWFEHPAQSLLVRGRISGLQAKVILGYQAVMHVAPSPVRKTAQIIHLANKILSASFLTGLNACAYPRHRRQLMVDRMMPQRDLIRQRISQVLDEEQ